MAVRGGEGASCHDRGAEEIVRNARGLARKNIQHKAGKVLVTFDADFLETWSSTIIMHVELLRPS